MSEERSHRAQMIGSLIAALVLVAIAIAVVTAQFGSTPSAELEAQEERQDARIEAAEERGEQQEEIAEERGEN